MRYIEKRREPRTVAETRCAATTNLSRAVTARDAFNQIDKGAVREQLAEEQGRLCAFCMAHISENSVDGRGEHTMKIAHRTPVDADPGEALNWQNLLGSCDGGQRYAAAAATCDYAQRNRALTVDPTQRQSIAQLRYERRDTKEGLFITSDEPNLRSDVETTLALNAGDLPALRAATWKAFLEHFRRRGPKGAYGRQAWRGHLPQWLGAQSNQGRLPAFLGVVEKMVGL